MSDLYIASLQTQNRLRGFATELRALCDRFGFDLVAEDSEIQVDDRRDARAAALQRDWPHVAVVRIKAPAGLEFAEYGDDYFVHGHVAAGGRE